MADDARQNATTAPEQVVQVRWEDAVQDHIEYVDEDRLCLRYKEDSFYFNAFDFRNILNYGTVCFDCGSQTWTTNFRYPRFASIVKRILSENYFIERPPSLT